MQNPTKDSIAFGNWPAVVTTDMVAGKTSRLSEPCIDDRRLFWLQTLPEEKGRVTIMMQPADGSTPARSLLPRPLSTRSKVHEYGGGSYCVSGNRLYFVLADDQQVYCVDLDASSFDPQPLTTGTIAFSAEPSELRYADLTLSPNGEQLLAVCEQHFEDGTKHCLAHKEPVTRLVCIATNGSKSVSIIAEGCDFYASPAFSPCGRYICWLSWNHPNMPWDATQLNLAEQTPCGDYSSVRIIAGNGNESLFQPQFSPEGDLFFVSDNSNWWNLYQISAIELHQPNPKAIAILPIHAEFATPQWTFNMSTYGFLDQETILAASTKNGSWSLNLLKHNGSKWSAFDLPDSKQYSVVSGIFCANQQAIFIASSPHALPAVIHYDATNIRPITSANPPIPQDDISIGISVAFPTGKDRQDKAYAFYYPPQNSKARAGSAPPLIVTCHGGPTGATESDLNMKIQYWTNRGFAVMDVNYRGSTGFGRHYRHQLHKQWGIYDVEDVCNAAKYAVSQGWADQNKLIIKGSSAGGYTVLAALTFSDTFSAGVSLYGIGNLETLVQDTHKFEARYLDSLIGNFDTDQQTYYQRSPIHFVDQINCPLLVFQGLDDKVVPPNQAETMVNAVRAKGLEVRYVTFTDEGHGFRNADNIADMLEQELSFYNALFQ